MRKTFSIGMVLALFFLSGLNPESAHQTCVKDKLILNASMDIIKSSKYCVLISKGSDGYPNARMMDPFPPDREWVIWMGTNSKSRKVAEIRKNNKISIYYESKGGDGYLNLKGEGFIINDQGKKQKYFKKEWVEFYPGKRENFILIKFVPRKLEIVSYKNGLLGDKVTWEAPSVILK